MIVENTAAAIDRISYWREDPVAQVKDLFGVTPDDWQGDALMAYPHHSRLAMCACVGPGKSFVEAAIALNFITTRPKPKIACTSITWPNLRDNLWAEMAKWIAASAYLDAILTWTQTRIFLTDEPNAAWIAARTWDRSGDAEQQAKTLSGLHDDYILALADETGGMPSAVLQAAEGVLSSCIEGHIIQAGNPTHLSGPLHKAVNGGGGKWHVLRVTGDPADPRRAPRVNKQWAQEMIEEWGYDSAFVRSKILGLFPLQATDALVAVDKLDEAFLRFDKPEADIARGLKAIGVDVARFGTDTTDIVHRDGDYLDGYEQWGGKDTEYTADRVTASAIDRKATHILVDDIGVGGGVTDKLKRNVRDGVLPKGIIVRGVNVGTASKVLDARRQPKFANKKAELSFALATRFRKGRIAMAPAFRDTKFTEEASDIRYGFAAGGRAMKIEDKDEYRKRHEGRSPNTWDAAVLAMSAKKASVAMAGWL